MARPLVTDRIQCRTCGHPMAVIWCADESWRGFNPVPSPGPGWWWSRHRRGMVGPADAPFHPPVTYRVHHCPVPEPEAGPDGQLALPIEVTVPAPRPVPARVATGRRASR